MFKLYKRAFIEVNGRHNIDMFARNGVLNLIKYYPSVTIKADNSNESYLLKDFYLSITVSGKDGTIDVQGFRSTFNNFDIAFSHPHLHTGLTERYSLIPNDFCLGQNLKNLVHYLNEFNLIGRKDLKYSGAKKYNALLSFFMQCDKLVYTQSNEGVPYIRIGKFLINNESESKNYQLNILNFLNHCESDLVYDLVDYNFIRKFPKLVDIKNFEKNVSEFKFTEYSLFDLEFRHKLHNEILKDEESKFIYRNKKVICKTTNYLYEYIVKKDNLTICYTKNFIIGTYNRLLEITFLENEDNLNKII